MPKKFQGENTKSADARARKAAQKNAEREQKEKAAEDAYWADDDKNVAKKQQRKDEREAKRVEQLQKKKELQELHDKEMAELRGKSGGVAAGAAVTRSAASAAASSKVTRAEIDAYRQRMAAEAEAKAKAEQASTAVVVAVDEVPLEENVNRLAIDGAEARTVDEALKVLSADGDDGDRHPEKRIRAAWLAYEELNLPRLKAENPNLRLSQLKQLLKKQWQKAPENPFNQH